MNSNNNEPSFKYTESNETPPDRPNYGTESINSILMASSRDQSSRDKSP